MASRYADKIAYKADIETIFQNLSKRYGKFSNVIDYKENISDYSLSFSYPAHGVTHGECVRIQLSSEQENITIVYIVSESIQKEFDCGNNRTHVEQIISQLGKDFESIAVSAKTKRNQKTTKIVAVIAIVVLLVGCLAFVRWLANSGGGDISDEKCAACQGSGMVNEGFLDLETCPVCKGTGLPPH